MKNLIPTFICLFLVIPCQARIITVDDDGPADFNNIQAAIDYSDNGDFIYVFPGTYTGPGNRDIDFLGKAVTVRSTDPNDPNIVAATIIDCNGSETEYHTGFYFDDGEDTNSVLEGLTVTNGYAGMGGAILCDNSSPTIANCVFRDNSSGFKGGGMYNTFFSMPTVNNCTFIANTADKGGGMYNTVSSSPTVTNCTFSGNSAYSNGGGMHNFDDSNPTVNNCTFSGNSADRGGGMFNLYNSSPTVTGCTFSENSAEDYGGGMCNYDSSPTVNNCTFSDNSANTWGGGIYNYTASPTLTNCTFSGNSANDYGGGMCNWNNSSPTVTGCTFSGNAADRGGAMYNVAGTILTANCVLWGNTATEGAELYLVGPPGGPVPVLAAVTVSYCDVEGGAGGVYVGDYATLNWGHGNIDVNPYFVDAGLWADANDPNIVVEPNDPNALWIDGDYHLKSFGWRWDTKRKVWTWDDVTSRCIDAGNPGCPLGEELLSVPVDPNNIWGQNLRINMGTYGGTAEASMAPFNWAMLGDLTNDGTVDSNDLAAFVNYWLDSGQCVPSDLNRNQFVDFIDFTLLGQDWFSETSWYTP